VQQLTWCCVLSAIIPKSAVVGMSKVLIFEMRLFRPGLLQSRNIHSNNLILFGIVDSED
jgi:hypothetical protein